MFAKLWEGSWTSVSKHSSLLHGKVYALLPTPLNSAQLANFKTNVNITYDGVYHYNQQVTVPMVVTSVKLNANVLNFEMLPASGSNIVEFQTIETTGTTLKGTYSSTAPENNGTLTMTVSATQVIPEHESKSCTIMWCNDVTDI